MGATDTLPGMATVILVRHGRTTANASGMLAGRRRGVRLDAAGEAQVAAVGERLAVVPLVALVTSPLERCRQTAVAIAAHQPDGLATTTERGLVEADYGDWQGQPLKVLAKDKLWPTVQTQPSSVTFPAGESMVAMSERAVSAVRRIDAELTAQHGPGAVWVAVSHGDIVKAILADALGMHLDLFQRIQADPASVSIVRYTTARPYVLASNTHAGDLSWLRPPPRKRAGRAPRAAGADDAAVGGGAGPGPPS